ncbi:ABC transporter substrate-binding protein [Nocardiopsis tropica]|jgi:polar amino acid transport system substrate-binding protein|uniref:ABC transporter substrate-binding protein n=1 Tax=Nocardiopsis tropica TaxID=109330 RepID=A0ABU7KMI4_9ACTN|nr:ABC transporter substrate-binding protein [Nocardiopsis umidischolae]MEE2050219.1 ABC transporter substrate-binding protein [Nocardiopsis umidischolae]
MALLKPHSAPLALGALSLAGVLALTACGGDGGASEETATPEAPAVEADEELAALVPADIAEAGSVTIGVEASYPPGEYLDEDGETALGFNVDLVTAALGKLGLEAEWVPTAFDSIVIGVDTGTYDLGSSSFTVTEERMEQVNMISYFSSGTQWFAQTGNPQDVDPDNACGMRIAVQSDTTHDADIEARSEACVEAGEEAITIQKFENQPLATETVVSGVNDASLADMPTAVYALEQTGEGVLELIGEQYDAAPYGVLTHKEDTELAEAVAAAFNAIIEDGTYTEILGEWGVEAGVLETAEVNPEL